MTDLLAVLDKVLDKSNHLNKLENKMSKGSDIKFAIVHHCKRHGAGLQLAIDLNFSIQCTLNWCEPDNENDKIIEQEIMVKYWNDYNDDYRRISRDL